MNRKLGKLDPKHDPRTLQLARYLKGAFPVAPKERTWSKAGVRWGMMLNDQLGDCTCAAIGHAYQIWTVNASSSGHAITVPDSTILAAYEGACGYKPGDPSTDRGGYELDVLNYWRQHGVAGLKLEAYVACEPRNHGHVRSAIDLFGMAYIGVALPANAQTQAVWSVVNGPGSEPGSWGGHAVIVCDYDDYGLTCVTWGELQRMTWGWWDRYCVVPETRVLTADLRWVQAGTLKVGDALMAFDENGPYRRWRSSVVEQAETIKRPCYRLTFSDGTEIVCSAEHKWLTSHGGGANWIRTDAMRVGGAMASKIVKPLSVWDEDRSWEAGYLAAAFDGEGFITQRDLSEKSKGIAEAKIGFAQKDNGMLEEVLRCLAAKGFSPTRGAPTRGVVPITIGKRNEMLRFLGQMQPRRLMPKFDPNMMGLFSVNESTRVALLAREPVGDMDVSALRTSSGTFLAEGLASHNCDEAYALLLPNLWAPPGQPSPSGFDADALRADLSALRFS